MLYIQKRRRRKNKKTKRIVGMLLSMVMLFSFSMTVSAQENEVEQDDRTYLIVNGEDIVYVGEDYENPETGEYVRWDTSSRGVDKSFSFCIRYSLTTSDFTVHSDRVLVTANAYVADLYGVPVNGYTGHLYTVSIVGWYSRNLQFSVGNSQSGTITGLDNGGTYKVRITNNDYLPDTRNLVGSGSVSTL